MKFITVPLLILMVFNYAAFSDITTERYTAQKQLPSQTDRRGEAFLVLRGRCNICHATKKRTDIFTLENMDELAPEIYEQVFVKKKMPKGRKIKLSANELNTLERWIDTVLDEKELSKTKKSR